jgi:hypothetical protein
MPGEENAIGGIDDMILARSAMRYDLVVPPSIFLQVPAGT